MSQNFYDYSKLRDEVIDRQERSTVTASSFASSRGLERHHVLDRLKVQESLLTKQTMNIRSMLSRMDELDTTASSNIRLSSPKHLNVHAHAEITQRSSDATLDSIRRIEHRRLQKQQEKLNQEDLSNTDEVERGILYGRKSFDVSRKLFSQQNEPQGKPKNATEMDLPLNPYDPLYRAKKDLDVLRQKREVAVKERLLRNAEELDRMEKMRENAIEKARKDKAYVLAHHQFTKVQTKKALSMFMLYTQYQIRQKFINLCVKLHKQKKSFQRMKKMLPFHRHLRVRGLAYEMKLAGQRLIRRLIINRNVYHEALKAQIRSGRHYIRGIVRRAMRELKETPSHSLRRLLYAGYAYEKRKLRVGFNDFRRWYRLIGRKHQSNRNQLQTFLDKKNFHRLQDAFHCFSVNRNENIAERKALDGFEMTGFRKFLDIMKRKMVEARYRYQLNDFADEIYLRHLKRKFLLKFHFRVRAIRRYQIKRQRFRRVVFFKNPKSVMMNSFSAWFKKHLILKRREVLIVRQIERLRKNNPTLSATLQRLRVRACINSSSNSEGRHFTVHKFYTRSIYLIGLNKAWRKFCVRVFQAAQRRLIKGRPRSLVVSNFYRRRYLRLYFQRWNQRKELSFRIYQKSKRVRCKKLQELAKQAFRKLRSYSVQLIKYDLARFHCKRKVTSRFLKNLRNMIELRKVIRAKRDRNPLLRKLCVISLHKWSQFALTNAHRKDLIRFMRAKTYDHRIKQYLHQWIEITREHAIDEMAYKDGKKHWLRKSVVRAVRQWYRATFHYKKYHNGSSAEEKQKYLTGNSQSSNSVKLKIQGPSSLEYSRKQNLLRSSSFSMDQPANTTNNGGVKVKKIPLRDQWYIQVMKKKTPIVQMKHFFKVWKVYQKQIVFVNKEKLSHANKLYQMKVLHYGMSKWIERYEQCVDQENLLGYYRMNIQIPSLTRKVINKMIQRLHQRHEDDLVLQESEMHYTKTVAKMLLSEWKQRIQLKLQVIRPYERESDLHYVSMLYKKYWPKLHHLLDTKSHSKLEMKRCFKYYKMKKNKPYFALWYRYKKVHQKQFAQYQISRQRCRLKIGHKLFINLYQRMISQRHCRWDFQHAIDFYRHKKCSQALKLWLQKVKSMKKLQKNAAKLKLTRHWFYELKVNHDQRRQKRLTYQQACKHYTKHIAKHVVLKEWKQQMQLKVKVVKPLLRKCFQHFQQTLSRRYLLLWELFLHNHEVYKYEIHRSLVYHQERRLKPTLVTWQRYCSSKRQSQELVMKGDDMSISKISKSFLYYLQVNAMCQHDEKERIHKAIQYYEQKVLKQCFVDLRQMIQLKRKYHRLNKHANHHHERRLVKQVFDKGFRVLLQEHMNRCSQLLTTVCSTMEKALVRQSRRQVHSYFEEWKKDTLIERKVALRLKFHHKQWYYQAFHKLKRRARQAKRLKRKVYGFIQMMLFKQRKLVVNRKDSPSSVTISFDCDALPRKLIATDTSATVSSSMHLSSRSRSIDFGDDYSMKVSSSQKLPRREKERDSVGGMNKKKKSSSIRQTTLLSRSQDHIVAVGGYCKPANFYHDGLRVIRSLLTMLEKKRQHEDRLEHAKQHHEVMAKQLVIHQLFHLRRNRIANDFFLKTSFQRFQRQLIANKGKYDVVKTLQSRSTSFALKRYIKNWIDFLVIKHEKQQMKAKRDKRFPIYQEIQSFDYYWNYHKRLFFIKYFQAKKKKIKAMKTLRLYDEIHIQNKLSHGFHLFTHLLNRKSKMKRNFYLLSLFETLQSKRRALRLWHSFIVKRFIQKQMKRIHLPPSVASMHSPSCLTEGTIRYDHNIKRVFKHLIQCVRNRKQKEMILKNPEKKREFLLKRKQEKAQKKLIEVVVSNQDPENEKVSASAKRILQAKKAREHKKLQSISLSHLE